MCPDILFDVPACSASTMQGAAGCTSVAQQYPASWGPATICLSAQREKTRCPYGPLQGATNPGTQSPLTQPWCCTGGKPQNLQAGSQERNLPLGKTKQQLLYNCIMTVCMIHSHHLAEPNWTEGTGETVSLKYFLGQGLCGGGVEEGLLVSIFITGKEEHIGDDKDSTDLFWPSYQMHCQLTNLRLVDAKKYSQLTLANCGRPISVTPILSPWCHSCLENRKGLFKTIGEQTFLTLRSWEKVLYGIFNEWES